MTHKTILLLSLLVLLAGCAAPEIVRAPQITQAATSTLPAMPSRVVTLSNATPLPVTPSSSPAVTAPAGVAVTLKGDGAVNLRSGPGATYAVIARAATGTRFTAVARSEHGEWLLLASPDLPGGQAWIYAAYTDYDPADHPLPAATAVQP